MERIVLDHIRIQVTEDELRPLFGKRQPKEELMRRLLTLANETAVPKAILTWAPCAVTGPDQVTIGEKRFSSVLLADKLASYPKVLCMVITVGTELDAYGDGDLDLFKNLISGFVLHHASVSVHDFLSRTFDMGETGYLQPGSLPDWPIGNNHALCEIVGNVEEIGITLNEAGYMTPWNSTSGILFPSMDGYKNCQLCLRADCVGRRAPFDKAEYERIFGAKE